MSTFNIISMIVLLFFVVIKGADLIADILVPLPEIKTNTHDAIDILERENIKTTKKIALEIESIEPLLAAANIDNGERVSKKCILCHTFEKNGKEKTGPNLWNIVGKNIGIKKGYHYSQAMEKQDGTWTFKKLNEYLYKPRKSISGTKMFFIGIKKSTERADLIAYLNSLSDNPSSLPTL